MIKRIIAMVLCCLLPVCLISFHVSAHAEGSSPWLAGYPEADRAQIEATGTLTHHEKVAEDGLSWSYDPGSRTITISGSGPMKDYYDQDPVDENDRMYWDRDPSKGWAEDAVLPPWSEYASGINTVIVEDGVTSIGDFAFFGYPVMQAVLPDSVEYIGKYAFGDTYIGEVNMPANLKEIADGGFTETRIHRPFEVPAGVEIIGKNAFYANDFYDTITIPASVYYMHETAFANGLDLHHFIVSEDNQFYTAVDGVLYTKDMSLLMNYPIYKEAEEYVIPDSVVRIGDWSVAQNYFLRRLTIPATVKEAGDSIFMHLYVLEAFTVEEGSSLYKVEDGVLYSADGKVLCSYPGLRQGDSFTVSSTVEMLDDGAFSNCRFLKELYVPDTVSYVSNYALRPLYNTNLYLPAGIAEKTAMHKSNLLCGPARLSPDAAAGYQYISPEARDVRSTVLYSFAKKGQEVPAEEELEGYIRMAEGGGIEPDHLRANAFIRQEPLQIFFGGSQEAWDAYAGKMELILQSTVVTCNADMPD